LREYRAFLEQKKNHGAFESIQGSLEKILGSFEKMCGSSEKIWSSFGTENKL